MTTKTQKTKSTGLYVLTGDEFLRRQAIEKLIAERIPSDAVGSANVRRLYADECDLRELSAQVLTKSLLADHEVFWIRQADQFKKMDVAHLESLLNQLPADELETTIIFEADQLPATHALIKIGKRYGHVRSFEAERAGGTPPWIREKLSLHGKTMTSGAMSRLREQLGASASLMDLCLDQLILYVESNTITEDDVTQVAAAFLRYEPFDLTEALAVRDIVRAVKILNYFLDLNGDAVATIGLLHWQIKRLWRAKKLLGEGYSEGEMAREVRIPPYRVRPFVRDLGRFERSRLESLLRDLWQIDWRSKQGDQDGRLCLEAFFAKCCAA